MIELILNIAFWLILIIGVLFIVWIAPTRDGIKHNWEPPLPLPKRKDSRDV